MPAVSNCQVCDKVLSNNYSLRRHISLVHPGIDPPYVKCPFECVICYHKCSDFKTFSEHLYKNHDVTLHSETHEFESESEFHSWKKTVESQENSSFVKTSKGKVLSDKSVSVKFYCHRSGQYRPKVSPEERKRELKIQGSSKIGGYCPASIKATFSIIGKVHVEYCTTHVGHRIELSKINLTLEERKEIATKIASKVPFDEILTNVRSSVSEDNLKRKHLITKQDLYNIESEFSLNNEAVRHNNDALSVEAWVEGEKKSDSSCVLIYKPQDTVVPEYRNFASSDFALGIMTEAQEELLKKFGSDCICVDSTHGTNPYGFEMVTLLVLDNLRQGFPCAFFISNKTDSSALQTFFRAIKAKVGKITCKVFMSDMAEEFFNAWKLEMGESRMRLFCTWHVVRAWKKNLTKIKDVEKQKSTFDLLRILQEDTDEEAFQLMQGTIMQQLLKDEATKEFGLYFQQQYIKCCRSWAFCYRQNAGINTNMHLEAMHKTLKHLFLKGQTVKRLDKAIHAIMQMVKTKLFNRLIVLEKGKVSSKLKNLRARHKKSLELNPDLISKNEGNSWDVASSSVPQLYTVKIVKENCNCSIVCNHCNACIHKFSCTCIDASIKWNMCKHIHLLCRAVSIKKSTSSDSESNLIIDEQSESNDKNAILREVADNKVKEENITRLREELHRDFNEIVMSVENEQEFKICKQNAKRIIELINAAKQTSGLPKLSLNERRQTKRKIECQKRFISKKKNKILKHDRTASKELLRKAINTVLLAKAENGANAV